MMCLRTGIILAAALCGLIGTARGQITQPIRVAPDQRGFVVGDTGRSWTPWGFNYDHDRDGRLLEDYWVDQWASVEEDFAEMKSLGANVVRIHLQFGRFMDGPNQPNQAALKRLVMLVDLAERLGLYLDVTGLGCYHKQDVPAWYDRMNEAERWAAQVKFWEAVSTACRKSPAIFCYDLMNEPVVPGGDKARDDWLGPGFGDKHFVQFITLDAKGRPRPQIAKQWIEQLVAAIRKHDDHHLITVGMVPWSLDRPGLTSGFVPEIVAGELDFIAVHLYPETGKLDEAIKTLGGFAIGKPVIIEETFPLKCPGDQFEAFIARSSDHVAGHIGFYWGKSPQEYQSGKTIGDAMMLGWLKLFAAMKPITIVLIGDSTVTDQAGWGKAFAGRFNDRVKVINFAAGGRSAKSFYHEKRLPAVLEARPDYVLIQFGHNGQPGKGPQRETDPATTYRDYLKIYISEARRIGATPIILSSLTRRRFDKQGRIASTLGPWAQAAGEVAAEMHVPFIDLYTASVAFHNRIGPDASRAFDPKPGDYTHLNDPGAEAIMDLIVAELKKTDAQLAAYLKPDPNAKH